jgi:hypothetical protein
MKRLSDVLPILGQPEIPDAPLPAPLVIPEKITKSLEHQVLDDLEVAKALEVTPGGPPLAALATVTIPATSAPESFLAQVQTNAREFESEGEAANGIVFENTVGTQVGAAAGTYMTTDTAKKSLVVEKSTDTQGKISNADEDGTALFDDGGGNVATPDSGADEKLYAGETIGNWGDEDLEDDDGPVSRATVGQESEADDDISQVPKGLLDTDDD